MARDAADRGGEAAEPSHLGPEPGDQQHDLPGADVTGDDRADGPEGSGGDARLKGTHFVRRPDEHRVDGPDAPTHGVRGSQEQQGDRSAKQDGEEVEGDRGQEDPRVAQDCSVSALGDQAAASRASS